MINREIGIAFLIALSLHVMAMSAVTIVTPKEAGRMRAYTRVDFLGSILRKAAFDIMLEDKGMSLTGAYNDSPFDVERIYLDVTVSRVDPGEYRASPYFDDMLDSGLERFLAGKKYVPEIFDVKKSTLKNAEKMSGSEKLSRKVVYRPEKPVLDGSVYEGKGEFRITVKFFIDEGGRVIKAEPVNTTGFPEVDDLAVQFVRGWMFEPRDNVPEEGQRQETDIVLVTEDRI